ncbi:hypothetical protein [Viridibacillus arvi]|uniref:hypothetical protein n=1 Tax=Viridibacillus arvi TaxID=263475 RepID=UPI0034CE71BA
MYIRLSFTLLISILLLVGCSTEVTMEGDKTNQSSSNQTQPRETIRYTIGDKIRTTDKKEMYLTGIDRQTITITVVDNAKNAYLSSLELYFPASTTEIISSNKSRFGFQDEFKVISYNYFNNTVDLQKIN